MDDFIGDALSGMDEEQAMNILNSLDEDQVEQAVNWTMEEMVVPHMDDVRQRARSDPPTQEVRAQYEAMPSDQRQQMFYDTLDELVATLVTCRERPKQGFDELKTMLRDPYTTEALLLIFENEDHIDEEYTQTLKEFGVTHIRWVGAMVLPELYEDHEVQQVMETFDLDPDGSQGSPGG